MKLCEIMGTGPILLDADCYFKPIDDSESAHGGKKCMLTTLAECLAIWLREFTVHMTKSPDGADLTMEEMVAYLIERNPHRKTGMHDTSRVCHVGQGWWYGMVWWR